MIGGLTFSALLFTLGSYHFNQQDYAYNQFNPGVAAEFTFRDAPSMFVVAGVYRNSFYRTTVHAQVGVMPVDFGAIKLGATIGLGTGYDKAIVGGLQARIGDHLNLTLVPPMQAGTGAIGVSLRFPI